MTRSSALSPLRMAQPLVVSGPLTTVAPGDDVTRIGHQHVIAFLVVADRAVAGTTSIGFGSPSGMRTRANAPGISTWSLLSKVARIWIVPEEVLIPVSTKSSVPSWG